jgi:hypothetical protein
MNFFFFGFTFSPLFFLALFVLRDVLFIHVMLLYLLIA